MGTTRMGLVTVVCWGVGCGEAPRRPPVDDVEGDHSAAEGTTGDSGPDTYVPELPTGVTEACWAWGVELQDGEYSAEYLRFYDPVTLSPTYASDDYDPNGVPELVTRYEYDGGGRITWRTDDLGAPPVDERWAYTYTGDRLSTATVDEGDDGVVERWYRYSYDAVGRLAAVAMDVGDDGVVDQTYTFTYPDAAGPDFTLVVHADDDGVADLVRTEVHDTAGRVVEVVEEGDSSRRYTNTYARPAPSLDVGLVEGSVSDPAVGTYTYRVERTFEAPGKVSREVASYDVGIVPLVFDTTWVWTCP